MSHNVLYISVFALLTLTVYHLGLRISGSIVEFLHLFRIMLFTCTNFNGYFCSNIAQIMKSTSDFICPFCNLLQLEIVINPRLLTNEYTFIAGYIFIRDKILSH